jgi:hypothetical protein
MATRRLVTSDLVAQVRSLIDEDSTFAVEDERDIIPALNRAQDTAASILAKMYESPLLTYKEMQLNSTTQEYDIPEDALEERVEKLEIRQGSYYYQVRRIEYRDITDYEAAYPVARPFYYTIIGHKFRLTPPPTGVYPLRVWYLKDPAPLVLEHGRITLLGSSYVNLESAPPDTLTSNSDELGSYVNLVDKNTGTIKATFQVSSVSGQRINLRSSPTRSVVQDRPVSGGGILPTLAEVDDYLCPVAGTCVPLLKKPVSNYIVEYAVADLLRKLGGDANLAQEVLKKMEQYVERSWAGREQSLRVKSTNTFSKTSGISRRRWYNL